MDYAKKKGTFRSSGPGPRPSPRPGRPFRGKKRGGGFRRHLTYGNLALLLLVVALVLFARYYWREMRWRYIVIHHTASDIGNMDYYRRLHMEEHGWPDIAYHFLINNGSYNSSVGQVEESSLWRRRSLHYSTKVSYINYLGIAIVLVGNFEEHDVPPLQREALINLVTRLAREYDIPPERIVGHREIWATACPGKHLHMIEVRRDVRRNLEAKEEASPQ